MNLSYLDPKILYRLRSMRPKTQPLAKALGLAKNDVSRVFDMCFGFGIDALSIAQWGCDVVGFERNRTIFSLSFSALEELGKSEHPHSALAHRIKLRYVDALEFLRSAVNEVQTEDVIYLDPMYNLDTKGSAKPKKRMQFLRELVGEDSDRETLLELALASPARRVVLKGPPKSKPEIEPTHSLLEKTASWHIYTK